MVVRSWLSSFENLLVCHCLWQNVTSWIGQNIPCVIWLLWSSGRINFPNLDFVLRWTQPVHNKRDPRPPAWWLFGSFGKSKSIQLISKVEFALNDIFRGFFPFGSRGFPRLGRPLWLKNCGLSSSLPSIILCFLMPLAVSEATFLAWNHFLSELHYEKDCGWSI